MEASTIYSGLLARGFSPVQAAALAGNIQQESAFNPAAVNPGEQAYGLLQWRLDRRQALENLARERGVQPSDVDLQLDFIRREMDGPEARNAAPFMSAQDLPSANAALRRFIRYGDNSEAARLHFARAFSGDQQPAQPSPAMPSRQDQPAPFNIAALASAPMPNMPAFSWSPQIGQPQAAPSAPPPLMAGPVRPPPDLSQLQALLQRAPALPPGFRFSRMS